MKIRFKTQDYQTAAVESVVDCFAGQPAVADVASAGARAYRIDPGPRRVAEAGGQAYLPTLEEMNGVRNAELILPPGRLLENMRAVQRRQNLTASESLIVTPACEVNLDVEMETGTGKTYCYIKTMFELNRCHGWTKFVVMVPSVAIREGVKKSFAMTAEHFQQAYGKKARAFVYDSARLSELEGFSSDSGINVMIINVQAFNATGADQRRIYEKQDSFQSRRPIDVIRANRPILVLDEPQKMEGTKTTEALKKFGPLIILRYSATHKTKHNVVHRLDALDAYHQKLVKKIAARGIEVRGLEGTQGYLYVEAVRLGAKGKGGPVAWVELEVRGKTATKRIRRRVVKGDDLHALSNEMPQYSDRWTVTEIDARTDTVTLANGLELKAGTATGDVTADDKRRLQIREAINAHLERERILFDRGVKVLTLFFIDEVAKYRVYDDAGARMTGEYAALFEAEYTTLRDEALELYATPGDPYAAYLRRDEPGDVHDGYFSIDKRKKTVGRLMDPDVARSGELRGESKDADAYDLILKDKERLLDRDEPVRFIFSHSALREGWDNPNVFVIAMLKHSDNTMTRRQEVGRGLRIAVDQRGERLDDPAEVHTLNVLTVVTSESYHDFVRGLQGEMAAALVASGRPRTADEAYFEGKRMASSTEGAEPVTVTGDMARQIHRWLVKNDYVTDSDEIAEPYHIAKDAGTLAELPDVLVPHQAEVLALVDRVLNPGALPNVRDGRAGKINPASENLHRQEFLALWDRINRKAAYTVRFDSQELVGKCVRTLDDKLRVRPLQYVITAGEQRGTTAESLSRGESFTTTQTRTTTETRSIGSRVTYDLLAELATPTGLTRASVAQVLTAVRKETFALYRTNPEDFIAQSVRLINSQKATTVVEHLSYDPVDERYGLDLFTKNQALSGLGNAIKAERHVLEYVVTDSQVERNLVGALEAAAEVEVYAKLPSGFHIPTPVGKYNPDWAIAFRVGSVKHVYFVAETKGSLESLELRGIEEAKIACAQKFFGSFTGTDVRYDVVDGFERLMELVA